MNQLTILSEQELEQLRTQYTVQEGAEHCPKIEAINALLDTIKARDLLADKTLKDITEISDKIGLVLGEID